MIYVVLFFLAFSLFLYVLLGGADYGAGIVELFSSKENQNITKKTIYRVMGPIWEANHIWIIIVLVVLWVAFPVYFNIIVISLHIPLTLILVGITLRGVSFIFRHYDAVIDQSQKLYNGLFRFSSVFTPLLLGMTFGAVISGNIIAPENIEQFSFAEVYIDSWLTIFSLLTGIFFTALCAFLSATLLIGEADEEHEKIYIRKSRIATSVVVLSGFFLILYGYFNEHIFIIDFIQNPYSITLIIISGLLLIPLRINIKNGRKILSRFFAGLQVILIIAAAMVAHFPYVLITKTNEISLLENVAPDKVIDVLGISLIIGGVIILPGLFHLLKSFKMIKVLEGSNMKPTNKSK
ncbi:cytochrome d ubiquinol oxidase subunit II [Galbibacter sp. EGI 63066]|uniref:cytochrome d ubiquinol oxidase subunit II n=1 Tax=Galbibacter sp. EGI 63066 TaxID=2993559 RepID=UPI002248FB3C|nr:cytochrome d ubiquinol oxidase subunit II [Galbibacter sp. EGI 63066]MCX2681855.1 cytochrome d ubiquinol oxidase subunit II [Galbibacter sp. EGI 63066]